MYALLRIALFGAACAVSVAGCGVAEVLTESGKIDYKSATKAASGPSLEIPPDLANPRADDRYAIPDRARNERTASGFRQSQSAAAAERSAAPSKVLPEFDGARIVREGNQRWLVVNQPPDKVWPLIREFWQENGFVIAIEQPDTGIMETDWAENRAKLPQDFIRNTIGKVFDSAYSTSERDRFRTRLERVGDSTEVFISHRGMVEVYVDNQRSTTRWQPRPVDSELEAEFLRRLVVRMATDQEKAKTQLAAASAAAAPPAPERAKLVNAPGGPQVEIAESFDRAWRRVGLALDRGGFTVEDRDRSQGLYFVRYIDPESAAQADANRGWLSRLFTSTDKANTNTKQYRVKVAGASAVTEVTVQNRDGQPVSTEFDKRTVSRMLALLHEQLRQ